MASADPSAPVSQPPQALRKAVPVRAAEDQQPLVFGWALDAMSAFDVPRIGDRRYLAARVVQVFDAPGHKRPRWTVQDAHSVREVLRLLDAQTGPALKRGHQEEAAGG